MSPPASAATSPFAVISSAPQHHAPNDVFGGRIELIHRCTLVHAIRRDFRTAPTRRLRPTRFCLLRLSTVMNDTACKFISRLLIAAILFAQMGVSAYACPSLFKSSVESAAVASADSMPIDCDQMAGMLDPAAPNLCSAHCHNHEQSADHADSPVLPPALFATLYWLVAQTPVEPVSDTPDVSVLHAALPPPHAILHCCFRI